MRTDVMCGQTDQRRSIRWIAGLILILGLPVFAWAQSVNSSISGTVTDPSGAIIPGVELSLKSVATSTMTKFTTGSDGLYSFPNLQLGEYEIEASAAGFRHYIQSGIRINLNQAVRVDIKLELGATDQRVEVSANASPLNFENGELKGEIAPEILGELPLIVGGALRSATSFVVLLPGVSTPGGNPMDTRINGGAEFGDEAVIDGVSMQDGANGQSGMQETLSDHPWSPDAVSEISVLTSNFEPQYGSTSTSIVTAVTKSGTSQFHGSLYEFLRNTDLNARQYGIPNRPKDLENDFGGSIGGPLKLPGIWGAHHQTYFFFNYEGLRIRGGAVTPTLSIPSMKERQGDFSDWRDATGKLIPIYDPATTKVDPVTGQITRQQFMGCDGNTPNVICPSDPRLQSSLASQWFKYLPTPTFPGPLNNYVVPFPVANTATGTNGTLIDVRIDHYFHDNDHFVGTVHYHGSWVPSGSQLPPQLSFDEPYGVNYMFLDRFNWDHTFSPRVLNHFAFGYNDIHSVVACIDKPYAKDLPQIPGVPGHSFPPIMEFQDFTQFGCSDGFKDSRPAYIANDLLTWVRGKHTFKFGGEYRILHINISDQNNTSGTFGFARSETGLRGVTSGNAIASFLLGAVDNASATFYTTDAQYARTSFRSLFFGDTWKARSNLSINYGLRWDMSIPNMEKYNNLSFFDPVGPNPAADGRPGRLAFAGTKWGDASFGARYPEANWYKAFGPRLGLAYSFNPKTVVRTGYGIYFQQAYYPGWTGGMSQDGFNTTPAFSSSQGGLQPAFLLSQGLPQNFTRPPFINGGADNGLSPFYRPFDGNHLPYAQQWNLTIERQITPNFYINAAYVGSKGTHLTSRVAPLNALNPSLLSMGNQLFDQFQPGQTMLDGVPIPYSGWVNQMIGCAPTVAQALLPFPQYCSGLYGQNEPDGSSTYHSFQFKAEKRLSNGIWMLASYTNSKLLTNVDNVQAGALLGSGSSGVISPFERQRNKALATDDIPQTLVLSLIYQLPFGKGKHFLNRGGIIDKVAGGWQVLPITHISSGAPLYFRSGTCNVPSQFLAGCIPAILPGANPWAQSKGSFDPNNPLLNAAAFQSANSFNFYYGEGPRISNLRGFGYHNQDVGLIKNTSITERVNLQFRVEAFNVFNWHIFMCQTNCFGSIAFNNDVSSPAFGMWNGSVSTPRNVQLGLRIQY